MTRFIRAFIHYDPFLSEWRVSLRRGRSFFGDTREQAIEAAMGSLPPNTTIKVLA